MAQSSQLDQPVSLAIEDIPLVQALDEISDHHKVYFSYSSDFIPVNQQVSVVVQNQPLSRALDELFDNTKIVYRPIGNQIVLRIDPDKQLGSLTKTEMGKPILIKKIPEPVFERPPAEKLRMDPIYSPELEEISSASESKMFPLDSDLLRQEKMKIEWESQLRPVAGKSLAQISLLPGLGTNRKTGQHTTNNVSVNLFVGANAGVNGLEVGGLLNAVSGDVKGIQIAGLGNHVGENVIGTQVGGLYNSTKRSTKGVQAAGLFNYSYDASAVQAAGLMNIVRDEFDGVQASGLFNVAGKNSDALQAAGLFNVNRGASRIQVGGLFNVAKDVKYGQVSALVNVAREVEGFQIGFINISDTVSGVPIGLINIVKKGYNKFEMYSSELLYFNIDFKLGAKVFYNIFHLGLRMPKFKNMSWGLGYGMGMVFNQKTKSHMNVEAMIIHINEREIWTNEINTIAQLKFLYSRQFSKKTHFFWGPSFNIMHSHKLNADTGESGSSLVPYAIIDNNFQDGSSLKGWIGLNVGFRF